MERWQADEPAVEAAGPAKHHREVVDVPVVRCAPADAVSGRTSRRSAASPPKYWPSADTRGAPEPPVVPSDRIDVSAPGACGANRCQAAIASLAWDHGQDTKKYAARETRCVRSVSEVTTPKLPPPPPRHAQYRSSFVLASTWRTRPSAVTTRAATRLSLVSPKRRAGQAVAAAEGEARRCRRSGTSPTAPSRPGA